MHAGLLDPLIETFAECLTTEAAHKIVALRADETLQARVDELADMANRGALSPGDAREYDRILAAYHFVTLMQARAHRFLTT